MRHDSVFSSSISCLLFENQELSLQMNILMAVFCSSICFVAVSHFFNVNFSFCVVIYYLAWILSWLYSALPWFCYYYHLVWLYPTLQQFWSKRTAQAFCCLSCAWAPGQYLSHFCDKFSLMSWPGERSVALDLLILWEWEIIGKIIFTSQESLLLDYLHSPSTRLEDKASIQLGSGLTDTLWR